MSKISKICEQCGEGFEVHPYRRSTARFCSKLCKNMNSAKPRISIEERLFANINVNQRGCWIWTGNCRYDGYGVINYNGVPHRVHRLVWEILKGDVPDGLYCCHICDVRNCCNPDHIFLGTASDNMDDKLAKGKQVCGEQCYNAKLTQVDVINIKNGYGSGLTYKQLSEKYNISYNTIIDICLKRTWKHVK